jgi:excinuclease ABC subunit A
VQLQRLVDAGNTVVMIEHDMRAVAQADWVIDVGPGAGGAGGTIVAKGTPRQVARAKGSRTAPFLARELAL